MDEDKETQPPRGESEFTPLGRPLSELLSIIRTSGADIRDLLPLPNEALCPLCQRLLRSHPAARAVAARRPQIPRESFCACAEERMRQAERRHRMANLPQPSERIHTLGNFHPRPGTEDALAAIRGFMTQSGPTVVTLTGGPGSGKSHLLEAVGRFYLECGTTVRYEVASALLDNLRSTFASDSDTDLAALMSFYKGVSVLLLDDLGMEKPSEFVIERLTAIVDERLRNGHRLAVATNLTEKPMAERLGFRLASRLFDRATQVVRVAYLGANDFRLEGV